MAVPNADFIEWVKFLVVALGGGSFVGYLSKRRYEKDSRHGKVAEAEADAHVSALNTLQDQLETERAINERKDATIERVSKERNDAVESAGMLRGKVEGLELEVHRLREDLEAYAQENRVLHGHIIHMEKLAEQVAENMSAQRLALEALMVALKQRQCTGSCIDCEQNQ